MVTVRPGKQSHLRFCALVGNTLCHRSLQLVTMEHIFRIACIVRRQQWTYQRPSVNSSAALKQIVVQCRL